jgi:histidine ammonia-lyase
LTRSPGWNAAQRDACARPLNSFKDHDHDKPIRLGEAPVTLADLVAVARGTPRIVLTETARGAMKVSEDWVARPCPSRWTVASRRRRSIRSTPASARLSGRQAFRTSAQARDLSRRLVVSNAAGVGRHLDREVVRAAMLIRAASLVRGYSAVRAEVVETILAMLDRGVIPVVPEYGSLGASGDLIPLAHMALVMSRDEAGEAEIDSGEAFFQGQPMSGVAAMRRPGSSGSCLGRKRGWRC